MNRMRADPIWKDKDVAQICHNPKEGDTDVV